MRRLSKKPSPKLVTLTPEQREIADHLIPQFLKSHRQVMYIAGSAGTGKSTLLAEVARETHGALLCAYTGKAASVLRAKTGLEARTLHSAFYQLAEANNDAMDRSHLVFDPIHRRGTLKHELLLLDECSVVPEAIVADILATGVKILAVGDPGQLGPVKGRPYFTKPDATLHTIHRQALDSAIIRQAHAAQLTGEYQCDGQDFQCCERADAEDFDVADVVLCHTDAIRNRINRRVRRMRGFTAEYPQRGELIVCLRNMPGYGVFNGEQYRVAKAYDPARKTIVLDVEGAAVTLTECAFVADERPVPEGCITKIDFGYCLTVHKAQGSEWPDVLIIDEYPRRFADERRRWLYTAITRAAKSVLIACKP